MSIFKARQFWTCQLGQLASEFEALLGRQPNQQEADYEAPGCWCADVGSFAAAPGGQVFVCGHLESFLCALQVPAQLQPPQRLAQTSPQPAQETGAGAELASRQLLALAWPQLGGLVDVRCGRFSSTLGDSVAALGRHKLAIFELRPTTSGPQTGADLLEDLEHLDPLGQLSHRLEQVAWLPLCEGQIPCSLLPLEWGPGGQGSPGQLPQRHPLLVQYTDQFLLSLVDHKKLAGHFRLLDDQPEQSGGAASMSECVGGQPAAGLRLATGGQALALCLSDYGLHCLPLAKLLAGAQQKAVQRAARNLATGGAPDAPQPGASLVELQLNEAAAWRVHLLAAPLQLACAGPSRLLVCSRYALDLYSDLGAHLWSQRLETPLVCAFAYAPEVPSADPNRAITLACSEAPTGTQLFVFDEQTLSWSASLASARPQRLWRLHLSRLKGALGWLDGSQLTAAYLGSNVDDPLVASRPQSPDESPHDWPLQLEHLERPLDEGAAGDHLADGDPAHQQTQGQIAKLAPAPARFQLAVQLDATGQAPTAVQVNCLLRLSPTAPPGATRGPLTNVSLTLDFDPALSCQPSAAHSSQARQLGEGGLRCELTNCWPDQREPLEFRCAFKLRTPASLCTDQASPGPNRDQWLLPVRPKSLAVRVHLLYQDPGGGGGHRAAGQCRMQSHSFALPLSMLAKLAHIDYALFAAQQSLDDVQANLGPLYKRHADIEAQADTFGATSTAPVYYVADLILRRPSSSGNELLAELLDQLVESDLICRGCNQEAQPAEAQLEPMRRETTTLESVDLLAQSLDCRLKFRSVSRSGEARRTSSEEASANSNRLALLSVALELASGAHTWPPAWEGSTPAESRPVAAGQREQQALVWFHLCDLSLDCSGPGRDMLAQHMREFKVYDELQDQDEFTSGSTTLEATSGSSLVLVSIECDHPIPVLFVLNHLLLRQAQQESHKQLSLNHWSQALHDSIQISDHNLAMLGPLTLAISANLHDELLEFVQKRLQLELVDKFDQLKRQLELTYRKFELTARTSLTLGRRLANLPEPKQQQLDQLQTLTGHYQLELTRLLRDLDELAELDREMATVPSAERLLLQSSRYQQPSPGPQFTRVID